MSSLVKEKNYFFFNFKVYYTKTLLLKLINFKKAKKNFKFKLKKTLMFFYLISLAISF